MADSDDDIEKLREELAEALGSARAEFEKLTQITIDATKAGHLSLADAKRQLQVASDGLKARSAEHKAIKSSTKDISSGFRDATANITGMSLEINELNEEIARTADAVKKEALLKKKLALEEERMALASNTAKQAFLDNLGKMTGQLVQGLGSALTSTASAVLRGSDGFQTATSIMSAGVGIANSATQAGAKALGGAGQLMAASGNKWGVALAGGAGAVGALSGAASELAKAGFAFLSAELQKTIQSFQSMTSSGALFSGGMLEMRQMAADGGYSLEQFSKVVSSNAGRMADGGMTVTEAAKTIANVGKEFIKIGKDGKSIRQNLINLGYSFEEHASMTAKITSDMNRGVPKNQRATDQEIATQTEKYAENLRFIANITGEDAKAKAEKIRQENTELAFEGEKAKMSKEQRAELEAAMAGMTDQERKNLRDRKVYGQVINKEGAIMEALVPATKKMGEQYLSLVNANNLTVSTLADAKAENAVDARAQSLEVAQGGVGKASAAGLFDGKSIRDILVDSPKWTPDNVDQSRADLAKMKLGKGSNELTEAQIKVQGQQIAVEKLGIAHIKEFSTAVSSVTGAITSAITALTESTKGLSVPTFWDTVKTGVVMGGSMAVVSLLPGLLKKLLFGGGAAAAASTAGSAAGSAAGGAASAGAGAVSGGIGKGLAGLGKGIEAIGTGAGKAIGGVLRGLAGGLKALGSPKVLAGVAALAGIAAGAWLAGQAFATFAELDWETVGKGIAAIAGLGVVAGVMGLVSVPILLGAAAIGAIGLALQLFPADKLELLSTLFDGVAKTVTSMGDAISTVVKSVFTGVAKIITSIGDSASKVMTSLTASIVGLSERASATKIFALSGSLVALGGALVPFGIGGKLATLIMGDSGFGQIATDLERLQRLDPDRLAKVADSMKKVTASMPTLSQTASAAASNLWSKITGPDTPPPDYSARSQQNQPTQQPMSATNRAPGFEADQTQNVKTLQQLVQEFKRVGEMITEQTKNSKEHIDLVRQLLDVNHSQLSVQHKTFNAVM